MACNKDQFQRASPPILHVSTTTKADQVVRQTSQKYFTSLAMLSKTMWALLQVI